MLAVLGTNPMPPLARVVPSTWQPQSAGLPCGTGTPIPSFDHNDAEGQHRFLKWIDANGAAAIRHEAR
jgi:hypothetical protein